MAKRTRRSGSSSTPQSGPATPAPGGGPSADRLLEHYLALERAGILTRSDLVAQIKVLIAKRDLPITEAEVVQAFPWYGMLKDRPVLWRDERRTIVDATRFHTLAGIEHHARTLLQDGGPLMFLWARASLRQPAQLYWNDDLLLWDPPQYWDWVFGRNPQWADFGPGAVAVGKLPSKEYIILACLPPAAQRLEWFGPVTHLILDERKRVEAKRLEALEAVRLQTEYREAVAGLWQPWTADPGTIKLSTYTPDSPPPDEAP